MNIINRYDGNRARTGYHTGSAVLEKNGTYYISTEGGTRRATKKEIRAIKKQQADGG